MRQFDRKEMIYRLNEFISQMDFDNLISKDFYISITTFLDNSLIQIFIEIRSELFINELPIKISVFYNYKTDNFTVQFYCIDNSESYYYHSDLIVQKPLSLEFKEMDFYFNYIDINSDKITVKLDKLSKFILKRPKIKSIKINDTI